MSETRVAIGNSLVQSATQAAHAIGLVDSVAAPLTKKQVRFRIDEIGIIPAVRVTSAEDALFAAETIAAAGIPIIEISTTAPGAIGFISRVVKQAPEVVVGAGSILNVDIARQCIDKGAKFLTSDGLLQDVVEFAAKEGIVVIPGAFTPTEIIAGWNAGSDFVKVFPCSATGGHNYIRSLKAALPQVCLIPAGGVNQLTARRLIEAGAAALGIGRELFPEEAIWLRQERRIQELARRFLSFVDQGRARQPSEF